MEKTAKNHGHATASRKAYTRKWTFLAVFVLVFFFSYSMLESMGLSPELAPEVAREAPRLAATALNALPVTSPTRILIPKLDREAQVKKPTSIDVATLDAALLSGVVRYPTSAKLGEEGNVVLFGHSSYLPITHNQAYKTFNGIQKLVPGDVVTVYSSDTVYTYKVRNVTKESANDAAIPLSVTGQVLTLSTCNSFGAKEDRFVVVADFVEKHPISL